MHKPLLLRPGFAVLIAFLAAIFTLLKPSNAILSSAPPLVKAAMATKINPLVAAGGSYVLYSYLVQKYAKSVVSKMMAVPGPETLVGNGDEQVAASTSDASSVTPAKLRPTLSKWTNLPTNPEDCLRWNQWITIQSNSNTKVTPETIHSLTNKIGRFSYRTYRNFEEIMSVHRPFWTLYRFLMTFVRVTTVEFLPPETQKMQPTGEPTNALITADAKIQDSQRYFGGLLRAYVTWFGRVVVPNSQSGCCTIEWTSTRAELCLPWNRVDKPFKTIENPQVSAKMSQDPWDIVKFEDGMICFKRGKVGYLVFDFEQTEL